MTENLPFYLSFSEYRTFSECPMKHFLDKVLQVPSPKNDSLIYGSAIHDSLEEIAKEKVYDKNLWKDIAVKQLIAQTSESYVKGYFGKSLIDQCHNSLLAFDFWERFKNYEVISIEELMFEPLVEVDGIPIYFKGLNDLGLRHKKTGRTLIVDYKSANKPWDIKKKQEDETFFGQLVLYQHFFSIKHNIPREEIDCAFITLPREKPKEIQKFSVGISEEYRSFIFNDIKKVAKQILYMDPTFREKKKITSGPNSFACFYCEHNLNKRKEGLCDNTEEQKTVSINEII